MALNDACSSVIVTVVVRGAGDFVTEFISEFTQVSHPQLQPHCSNLTDKLLSAGKVSVKLGEDAVEPEGKLLKLGTKR
jgi:hypothetical protein